MEPLNVRTTFIWSGCVAVVLAACAWTNLQAQPPQTQPQTPAPQQGAARSGSPQGAHHGIAVVDITYILDHHPRLKADMEAYKRDFENTGAGFKKEQEALVKKAEGLKALKPGSPDFKKLEEELAQKESDLKVKAALGQKEFAERESKMYLRAYQEVAAVIRQYAERHNISLVLRFSGAPADPNNRDAVRAELLKTIQYSHRDIDITDPILAELGRAGATATPQNNPARNPPPAKR